MRLIVKKKRAFRPPLPISMLGTSLKCFGRAETYFATLIWGEKGKNWVVSRIFALIVDVVVLENCTRM